MTVFNFRAAPFGILSFGMEECEIAASSKRRSRYSSFALSVSVSSWLAAAVDLIAERLNETNAACRERPRRCGFRALMERIPCRF